MKRLLSIIVLSCFIASLSAQTMEHRMLKPDKRKVPDPTRMLNIPGYEKSSLFNGYPGYKKIPDDFLKSSNEIKQKLDSVIYDYLDMNGQWVFSDKIEYDYNESGKLIHETGFTTQEQGDWMLTYQVEFIYEPGDMLTRSIRSIWDTINIDWKNDTRNVFFYDDYVDLLDSTITERWNDNDSLWFPYRKYEYYFDGDGKLIEMNFSNWIDTAWRKAYNFEYAYNNENYVSVSTGYFWENDQWEYRFKTEYTYDYLWNMILKINYDWASANWEYEDKFEFTYDDNDNLIKEVRSEWDDGWELGHKVEYTYDNDYAFNDLVLPVVNGDSYDKWWAIHFNHMPLQTVHSDMGIGSGQWEEAMTSDLFYSDIEFTAIAEVSPGDFLIYPNPASSVFRLQPAIGSRQHATIEIYDLKGRKLLEKQIPAGSEEATVDVSHLQSGLYMCRIRTESGSVTEKLIIQK